MQKIDAMNTQVNTQVTVIHAGVTYKATVLRAPTFNDKTFRPQQFKIFVKDGEWAGNHYVSYTAVHTAQADKNQKARAEAEAKAKAERAEIKVAKPKAVTLSDISDDLLLAALADRLGYTLVRK